MYQSLAPILPVPDIEPCLPFWIDDLGFEKIAEVPHEEKLGFAMLKKDGVTIMYQSHASIDADDASIGRLAKGQKSFLYVSVDDVDALIPILQRHEVVVPRRVTPYGATEFFVKEPGGHVVGFATHSS